MDVGPGGEILQELRSPAADTAVAGRADTDGGAYFDTQRATLADAVRMREIDPASAHDVMRELDARQAGVTPPSD